MNEERRIENIPIDKIIPNIYQPRIKFDDKSITDLANSIKLHGIIQPLIVRKLGEGYEIIDGERRYKAAKKIGLLTIPSIVLNIDDKTSAELTLTENMQKQLLTPIEEANAYKQIMLLNKIDENQLAEKLGKDKSIIENKIKLLTLSSKIQEALLNNKIAEGHAKALTKITDKEKQIELFERVLKERIPVKVLEDLIQKEIKNEKKNEIDAISLNDLNNQDFLKKQKENKMEAIKMDNTQMNFNQYNNLLKEKEKPEMVATLQPEPIIGNTISEPKSNDFFPSLEEQPLNLEVPVVNEPDTTNSVQMPQFEVPTPSMVIPEPAVSVQQPQVPVMETPQMFEVPNSVQMPQFGVLTPSMVTPEPAVSVQQPQVPSMEAPQMFDMPTPVQMPQYEVPTPSMVMPESNISNSKPIMTNVMPAVNMIRNLIPLLENSGYKINIEETDNPSEYQIVLKVEK